MKILGALFIITSSVLSSYFYEKRLSYVINELKEIEKFVSYISNQIEYFSLSLNEIYRRYGSDCKTLSLLAEKKRIDYLGDDIEEALFQCFDKLGTGFKDEELKRLLVLNNFISAKIHELESAYKERTRVFRTIAFFVGFSVVILLV